MDALEELAHAGHTCASGYGLRARIELAEVGAGAEPGWPRAVNDQGAGLVCSAFERGGEFFQLLKHGRADFIARLAVQRELQDIVGQLPGNCLAPEAFHASFLWYICSICIW